jgi:predicted ATP-dependent serine protease
VARPRSVYRCAECGHDHSKWDRPLRGVRRVEYGGRGAADAGRGTQRRKDARTQGRCGPGPSGARRRRRVPADPLDYRIPEFDFVMGGGIVRAPWP